MSAGPRTAVVFQAPDWDEFVERQFRRLRLHARQCDVFILLDESRGPAGAVDHGRVLRITDGRTDAAGLVAAAVPGAGVFAHNPDYPLYVFAETQPEYDVIILAGWDCCVNVDLGALADAMRAGGIDLVAQRETAGAGAWRDALVPYYAPDDATDRRSLRFAAVSRHLVGLLHTSRLLHAQAWRDATQKAGVPAPWPDGGTYVGTEVLRLRVRCAELDALGDASAYRPGPPWLEGQLPALGGASVIRPVLDTERFLAALPQLGCTPADLFTEGSWLRRQADGVATRELVPALLRRFLAARDDVAVAALKQYAAGRDGAAAEALFNVAVGKPATQSSTSEWSRPGGVRGDAAGAVSGVLTGGFGFHTAWEDHPWWMLDLEVPSPVREVRVFNRMDAPDGAAGLVVMASLDALTWTTLHALPDGQGFGGTDGYPLRLAWELPATLRFLRLTLPRPGTLHLDEVEVFV